MKKELIVLTLIVVGSLAGCGDWLSRPGETVGIQFECVSTSGNCDGDPQNGCETPLNTVENCGNCGQTCANANGTTVCSNGACRPTCSSGFGDCDGNPNNGCETSLNTLANCGECGRPCALQNAFATCTTGQCLPTDCFSGYGNCDGNVGNGCEVNLNSDPQNCGECGKVCNLPNAAADCAGGQCTIFACMDGYANCNGNVADGCETDLRVSPSNCGSCGNRCSDVSGTPSCSGGRCSISCQSGFGDCDGNPANGCETSLTTTANCGRCANACSSNNGTPSCTGGQCLISCNGGFENCDNNVANGCEANLLQDPSHCGSCEKICNSTNGTASCSNGACSITCTEGFGNCDGNADSGCEVNLATDSENCGSCGRACSIPNGTGSCVGGACVVASCNTPFADCDSNPTNGCETNTSNNPLHCNQCNTPCPGGNDAFCNGGVCSIQCPAGFGNCDGNPNNGCETNLNSDVNNCATCENACVALNATPICTNGQCGVGNCNAGFVKCSKTGTCSRDADGDGMGDDCDDLCPGVKGTPLDGDADGFADSEESGTCACTPTPQGWSYFIIPASGANILYTLTHPTAAAYILRDCATGADVCNSGNRGLCGQQNLGAGLHQIGVYAYQNPSNGGTTLSGVAVLIFAQCMDEVGCPIPGKSGSFSGVANTSLNACTSVVAIDCGRFYKTW